MVDEAVTLVDRIALGRARAELGFAPRVDLHGGTRTTLAWYRTQGWI